MGGPEQQVWLDRVEAEHDNLRAALTWSCTSEADVTLGLALIPALLRFWLVRGYLQEGRAWSARLCGVTTPAVTSFQYARAKNVEGVLATEQGDYAAGRAAYEEALSLWRTLGDRGRIAGTLNNLSAVLCHQGELASARALQEECLLVFRELGDPFHTSTALGTLAGIVRDEGDHQTALAILEETLAIKRAIGDLHGVAQSLSNIGIIACQLGDAESARAPLEEGLALFQTLGDTRGLAQTLEGLALVACAVGAPGRAARIWGAAEQLRLDVGALLPSNERTYYDCQVALARMAIGDDQQFDAAWKQGRAMTPDEAVRYASAGAST
jgi:tetratricopeptide (TPR) repeat protein